jgi:peptidoglycan/xylan/chitin deacetylase (PgdA/CDA1 family)
MSILDSESCKRICPNDFSKLFVRFFLVSSLLSFCVTFPVTAQYVCDANSCQLPLCHCASSLPPGGLSHNEIPQFVLITFDDAINIFSEGFVQPIINGLQNPDGRMVPLTYFINKENTTVDLARQRYLEGHELANHTATHNTGSQTTLEEWRLEIKSLNRFLVNDVGLISNQIAGFRAPYLATNEAMWQALGEIDFMYDSSIPEIVDSLTGLSTGLDSLVWPHTLDYGSGLACTANHCPEDPVPGLWSIPMWHWYSENGMDYGAMDPAAGFDSIFQVILNYNFEQHYNGNRCPLGIYLHAGQMWSPGRQEILRTFLEEKLNQPDVWMITMRGLIEWMRNPVPANGLAAWFTANCHRGECFGSIAPPGGVLLLSPADGEELKSSTASFLWDVLLTASNYHFQLSKVPDFSTTVVDDSILAKTTLEATNLENAQVYYWRVRAKNFSGYGDWSNVWSFTTDYDSTTALPDGVLLSDKFFLGQSYPNPFNSFVTINFTIPSTVDIKLKIYDATGKEIAKLINRKMVAGSYSIQWDGNGFASGQYFYRIQAENFIQTKRMILLK